MAALLPTPSLFTTKFPSKTRASTPFLSPINPLSLTNSRSILWSSSEFGRRVEVRCHAMNSAVEVQTKRSSDKPRVSPPFRVGHGFDLHRLEPGLPLIIGGINIPHDRGCEAHSDGDVLLHCVVDAILGALGLPDIGQIFPDSDPKWRGAESSVFMREARPKLSPHKESIRANLCELLGADPSVVNLKAKTHEKVDSLGENRSIAAHTVVLLIKK
ncbi:2-C-methyl-D-erythritol 2,4-cyclodiphosphate synthase, chloroplastic isoform X2 [Amborella trichopoda]|uniref:2-C-methyl-D-erythritol 2,4-cyclodiphosphate synthase, chloroplastic isoform X2 n=1 Tax=Amborella trichopoda TaxID=13333 RepID=UPI0009BFA584|nr:2-C-methyl-D-erythritol 2,4-cyclodiphosphate synthase, chloroplastic isoform X2 [Amborella trichopoda]|eukprot:XP_020517285.1 2-C-methyl-D-erythritol 2,4-cyclodiphosphate synthase, chloroplastic isoform X2 [Amborella trichopoda]